MFLVGKFSSITFTPVEKFCAIYLSKNIFNVFNKLSDGKLKIGENKYNFFKNKFIDICLMFHFFLAFCLFKDFWNGR